MRLFKIFQQFVRFGQQLRFFRTRIDRGPAGAGMPPAAEARRQLLHFHES